MKNGVCRPPSSFVSTYTDPLNFVCGVIDFGVTTHIPRSRSSFSTPRSRIPMLSPAIASSMLLRNISTPVTTVSFVSLIPTRSTLSPTFTTPRSIRPVATVPRPVIENTSSTGIKNGLSSARSRNNFV